MNLHAHRGPFRCHLGVSDEDAAAGRSIRQNRVGDVERVFDDKVDVPVDAVVRVEVELRKRFRTGHGVVAVVEANGKHVLRAGHDLARDVEAERHPASHVSPQVLAVEPNVGHVHRRVELQEQLSTRALPADEEALAVPAGPLPLVGVAARFPSHQALDACRVRKRRRAPSAVVERSALRTLGIGQEEPPTRIEIDPERAAAQP